MTDTKYFSKNQCQTQAKPFDPFYDYTKDLKDDELKYENGKPFVYLKGLERLAKERGVRNAVTVKLEPIGSASFHGVICTYQYSFDDGRIYTGSADATVKNCDGNFKLYLTAMAESRAKARALRTAFGITLCSVEEKSDATVEADPVLGPIGADQIHLIKLQATKHNLGKAEIFNLLEVPRDAKELKNLTKQEGIEILTALNKMARKSAKAKKK